MKLKLTVGAALVVRLMGAHSAFINRPATVSKLHQAKEGDPLRVDCMVTREQGEPFEICNVLVHPDRHSVDASSSDVQAWPDADAKPAEAHAQKPTRDQLDAELAALPGAWPTPSAAIEDLRARYGKLFTKADEKTVQDFKPTPTRELLDQAIANLPGVHTNADDVVNHARAFFGDLFTEADEAKVRELVKKPD